jgi:osmotically-inducible protein OsmY
MHAMTITHVQSDADIQQQVLQELKWDPRVDETEVGVQVRDGVVTLTGHIASLAKKLAAREAAHRVRGVLDVADEMQVKIKHAERRTDSELAQAVRMALEWNSRVPNERIRTTVADGVVTLEGEVYARSEREDAQKAVELLSGVRAIVNSITVEPRAVDSNQIRHAIEGALSRQAAREAKRIHVGVDKGVVRLVGTVRSWSEKNAIEHAAGYTPGVVELVNELKIDSAN